MLRFILFVVIGFILYKLVVVIMKINRFRYNPDSFNRRKNKSTEYRDIEEAEFTEIKPDKKSIKE